ncbi:hypothetical protein Ocin01_19461 [Orchesella cincta]|uniref:DUF4218 domain-containing protein n=1 Tax=Orchesella cincta TaxID=48709 RepID=A0A1D2M2T3_ORCCI|nr:hypothetical protein Ocin01_19461 [Orchesella cincta]
MRNSRFNKLRRAAQKATERVETVERTISYSQNNQVHHDSESLYYSSDTESATSDQCCNKSCSEESDSETRSDDNFHIRAALRNWSLNNNITHQATTELLKILKQHTCFSDIPKDARTLLSTPKSTRVKKLPPGDYVGFDWVSTLKQILQKASYDGDCCKLHINIDGIPIYHSSQKQFWPVLANVVGLKPVFAIGIYSGEGKPANVDDFLEPFVRTYLQVHENGITIDNKLVRVLISAFICDAPARALISGVKSHTGYYSWKVLSKHHVENTILRELPVDLVSSIPLEYMHLICLGVVRKLIYLWTKGKKSPGRICRSSIEKLNNRLGNIRRHTPAEFSRKPRSLKEIDHWKATELRQFLFYTGPVILRGILDDDHYLHFLSLSVAASILQNRALHISYNNYASELLQYFVKCFGKLYGKQYISYNVHGLIHVAEDCKQHGTLEDYSGFKFENHLQYIKRLVRAPNLPLQQVHNRIGELERAETLDLTNDCTADTLKQQWECDFKADFPNGVHFRVCVTTDFTLKITSGNNCF